MTMRRFIGIGKLGDKDNNEMATDTSREAVEALITEERASRPRFDSGRSLIVRLSNTLAALLNERDALQNMIDVVQKKLASRNVRIRDLETDTQAQALTIRAISRRAERAEAERDAYKRAKAENDDRFQIEASKHRERAERAEAKLDAVKAWATAEDKATEMSWSDYNCGRGDVAREALTFLADTDDVSMYWSNDADS